MNEKQIAKMLTACGFDVTKVAEWEDDMDGEITIGDGMVYVQVGDNYMICNHWTSKERQAVRHGKETKSMIQIVKDVRETLALVAAF